MVWITGERNKIVYSAKLKYDNTCKLDEIRDLAKETLNNVHLWAVRPTFTNEHFSNMYVDTFIIDRMGIKDFEKLINKPARSDYEL